MVSHLSFSQIPFMNTNGIFNQYKFIIVLQSLHNPWLWKKSFISLPGTLEDRECVKWPRRTEETLILRKIINEIVTNFMDITRTTWMVSSITPCIFSYFIPEGSTSPYVNLKQFRHSYRLFFSVWGHTTCFTIPTLRIYSNPFLPKTQLILFSFLKNLQFG